VSEHNMSGEQIPGIKSWVTKFCIMAPNIHGSPIWNLLHVNLLMLEFLSYAQIFSKIVQPCSTHFSKSFAIGEINIIKTMWCYIAT